VTTRSSKDEILGYDENRKALKIKVRAPAVEGKANEATRRLVANTLNIPPSRVHIDRGEKSRLKVLRVMGIEGCTEESIAMCMKNRP
jgi:uncharacterized protein (TIGR00251 family)